MENKVKKFLTYGDVVEAGACLDGVLAACKKTGVWYGQTPEMLKKFGNSNAHYIERAAGMSGNGDGNGNGYGDGDGDGNGNGNGYGNGNGNGNGYGNGYGNG